MTVIDDPTLNNNPRKPRTRQRIHKEPPALAIPDINDDATERKRVLNVLAQRRYRERKRHAKCHDRAETTPLASQSTETRHIRSRSPTTQNTPGTETHLLEATPFSTNVDLLSASDAPSMSLDLVSNVSLPTRWPITTFEAIEVGLTRMEESYPNIEDPSLSTSHTEASVIGGGTTIFSFLDTIDPSSLLDSLSSSPSASGDSKTTDLTFPDSYYLPVNELVLLRGLMRIASRLRCNTTAIWELGANSPFNDGTHTILTTQELPEVWRPTLSQSSTPHHPVIDLLPWPSVRDRLIMLMSLPDEARPPAAAGPLAIAQLAYDLEDAAEGVRIWGDDPCEPTSWEVGQVLFERWWFVFDRQVIDQSNYWRRLRGAATLSMKS
ncbi:hypothetical protein F4802DRAFT_306653 [Xylaria palmicola]|nr:hypothetical protein F4802DRAFT_306653 [Xylaria palmicola]